MRNGLNISGVSELVHEITTKPEEAPISFEVATTWRRDDSAHMEVRTAHHGTIRMARGFKLEAHPLWAERRRAPTPQEYALAALGSCVLITHAHGFSARGVSLNTVSVEVTGSFRCLANGRPPLPPERFEDLRYTIRIDCDGDADQMKAVPQFVTCFSPNHRAFVDECDFEVEVNVSGARGEKSTFRFTEKDNVAEAGATAPEAAKIFSNRLRTLVSWEYGTQAEARMSLASDLRGSPAEHAIIVDQSKQMIGLDRGLNPQELLLAAIGSELVFNITSLAEERGVALEDVDVMSRGRLDIRGMLNVNPSVPARFHGLKFAINLVSDADRSVLKEIAHSAIRSSFALACLQAANTIGVEVFNEDRKLLKFESSREQALAFLKKLAELQQQQKQQQQAANGQ